MQARVQPPLSSHAPSFTSIPSCWTSPDARVRCWRARSQTQPGLPGGPNCRMMKAMTGPWHRCPACAWLLPRRSPDHAPQWPTCLPASCTENPGFGRPQLPAGGDGPPCSAMLVQSVVVEPHLRGLALRLASHAVRRARNKADPHIQVAGCTKLELTRLAAHAHDLRDMASMRISWA